MPRCSLFTLLKFEKLCQRLDCAPPLVVGCLEYLAHYTAQHHPTGVLRGMSVTDIAAAAKWPSSPATFVGAMVKTRFLDRRSRVYEMHDWLDWCPRYVIVKLARTLGCKMSRESVKEAVNQQRNEPVRTARAQRARKRSVAKRSVAKRSEATRQQETPSPSSSSVPLPGEPEYARAVEVKLRAKGVSESDAESAALRLGGMGVGLMRISGALLELPTGTRNVAGWLIRRMEIGG